MKATIKVPDEWGGMDRKARREWISAEFSRVAREVCADKADIVALRDRNGNTVRVAVKA